MPADRNTREPLFTCAPEDVPEVIREEAKRLLATTEATAAGRTFHDRAAFGKCLYFLAVLTDDPAWDFLRGG